MPAKTANLCPHRRVLKLPTWTSGDATLELRQCFDCKTLGAVDRDGNIMWAREDDEAEHG